MQKGTYNVGPRREWKTEEFDGLKPTTYDWCRMAAFIDGEGHLSISGTYTAKGRPRYQVRILIGNTNAELPLWLRETFGGHTVVRDAQRYNPRSKQSYIWSANAARACWIMKNCEPWFLMKLAQAKLLMQLQERIDLTRQGRGREVPPEEQTARMEIKQQLHKLNQKGISAQAPILTSEEMGQTKRSK